jgi:hypothetical protein
MNDTRARLQANGASDLAIAWRVDHDPVRRDFLRGAEAMRARILAGIRRWWGVEAKKAAGYRWPGHPHWLESAVAGIDAEQMLPEPTQPGANAATVPGVSGAALPAAEARTEPRAIGPAGLMSVGEADGRE